MKVIDDNKCKQYASTFVEHTLNIILGNQFSDVPNLQHGATNLENINVLHYRIFRQSHELVQWH